MSFLRYIFIICLFLFVFKSYGQAPGYLGKKFFIEGSIGLNVGMYFGDDGIEGQDYKISRTVTELSANMVISRYRYIALEIDRVQFMTPHTNDFVSSFTDLNYKIRNQSIGIGLYRTTKKTTQSLSPLGFFFGWKLSLGKSKATPFSFSETDEKLTDAELTNYNNIFSSPELPFWGIELSTGYRTILNDRFTLNYSCELGYNSIRSDLENDSTMRLHFPLRKLEFNNSLYLNITIGAGVLLF